MSNTLEITYVRVKLDGDTYQAYEQQANRQGKPVEDLIAQRLNEVKAQDSYDGRTVIINPTDRTRLESAIQRNFVDGAEMVNYLINEHTVKVGGISVELSAELLRRLRARCGRNDWETFIGITLIDSLERYVGMR